MTISELSGVIWPVLLLSARMQRVLTYGDLEGLTGIPAQGQNKSLGLIHAYCESRGYPLLNSIVVSADSGFPGEGFPKKMTPGEHMIERARVFAYGWSNKEKPRSHDFEAMQSTRV